MKLGLDIRTVATDQRGAALVLFVLFAPVAVLFMVFVIDVGNWFYHSRHLQLQADAGALAAAQAFQPCVDSAITTEAQQYSGVSGSPLYNTQIGGTPAGNIHELINSKTYYNQSSPVDQTVDTRNPCAAEMVDVKMTETNLPWFFNALGIVPNINAHARVSILQETIGAGELPIAVDETTPIAATAYVVNEDNGSTLATVPLQDQGPNGQGQEVWSNNNAGAVKVTSPHTGVIVALSGSASDQKCGDQYVSCYDASPSLLHIQGYSLAGTGSVSAPIARKVTLSGVTCTDGYFSSTGPNCTIGVTAAVDVGANPNPRGVAVNAVVGGKSYPMTYSAQNQNWTASGVNVPSAGSNQVDLQVTCNKNTPGSPCAGKSTNVTLSDVQRSYIASSATSGIISYAGISEGGAPDANSFEICEAQDNNSCTHNLTFTVNVQGSLSDAQSVSDPLYTIRFGSGNTASQTGAVACPPGGQGGFRTSLQSGCSGTYQVNTNDPGCANTNPLPGPADCISTDNGFKSGQLRQGLTSYITTPTNGRHYYCANNWKSFPNIPADDSRVVQVFISPFGSFGGSGNTAYPIQSLASFYVTGWDGDPCKSDDPAGQDQIVGHFIKYVNTLNTGGTGSGVCNTGPNALGTCVAVLTQ